MLKSCGECGAHGVSGVKSGALEESHSVLPGYKHRWLHGDILGCIHLTPLYKSLTPKGPSGAALQRQAARPQVSRPSAAAGGSEQWAWP